MRSAVFKMAHRQMGRNSHQAQDSQTWVEKHQCGQKASTIMKDIRKHSTSKI